MIEICQQYFCPKTRMKNGSSGINCITQGKVFQKRNRQLFVENSFFIFRKSEKQSPVAYVYPSLIENVTQSNSNDKELKVFILNDESKDRIKDSLKQFTKLFNLREKTSREFWLLDVSSLLNDHGFENVIDKLKDLKLDLDDDLYLYNFDKDLQMIRVHEFYEIHATVPRQLLSYGTWNESNGLLIPTSDKWLRRKDLKVHY